MDNVFKHIPDDLPAEYFETLVRNDNLRVERIVSRGHTSPEEGWYDQDRDEWVIVLRGAAILAFDDGSERRFGAGDYLEIPARKKHRVAWTDPDQETVWLVVHYLT